MRIRLALFSAALLLLPPLALLLSGQDWPQADHIEGSIVLPSILSLLAVLACTHWLDTLSFRRSGSSLLRTQRTYTLWLSISGALLCAVLACINIISPLWLSPLSAAAEIALAALFGGVLLPAVLITRLWLSSLPALLRLLTRTFALPVTPAEPAALLLLTVSLTGLLGGSLSSLPLAWLLWLSPLMLLIALQLLWHESTVFSGLKHGDWSRVALGAASGILVGGGALGIYQLTGGAFYLATSFWYFTLLLAAFGLLCLQLGDVVAESWRGKKRAEIFKKKPFPIPVVAKKD